VLTTITPKGHITEKLYSQPRHSIYVHYGNCSKQDVYTFPVSGTLPPPTDLDPIPKSWSFLSFQMEGYTQDSKGMTPCSHRPFNPSSTVPRPVYNTVKVFAMSLDWTCDWNFSVNVRWLCCAQNHYIKRSDVPLEDWALTALVACSSIQ